MTVAAVALAFAARAAAQSPPGSFAFERAIDSDGAGARRLPVDAPLLARGRPFRIVSRGGRPIAEGGLADLRLFDAAGGTVPHILVHPRSAEPRWIAGRPLPVPATKRTSGFEVDLGEPVAAVDAIRVEGLPAPFLKRLSVDGSGDRARWVAVAPDATLFDLPAEGLRQLEVPFAPGAYRYIRVTWHDTDSARVPMPARVRARHADGVAPRSQPPVAIPVERVASEPGRSRYRLRLPGPRVPAVAVEVVVSAGHVFRQAFVTESRFTGVEASPAELGRATLARVVRDGIEAGHLRVPLSPPTESELQLVIEDADNAPLDITRVDLVLAELPQIYFEAPGSGVVARYGDRTLDAPSYDLEAIRASLELTRVREARWREPRDLSPAAATAAHDVAAAGASIDADGFAHVRDVPSGSGGLVALQLDAAALAGSRGPDERLADVRLLDRQNRQIPYLLERRDEPLRVELTIQETTAAADDLGSAPGQRRSVYRVSLPYPNLPPGTLVLETTARVFARDVQAGFERGPDRQHRDTWFQPVASATWRHIEESTAARPLALSLPAGEASMLVVVNERDNAPLPIASATLLLPSYRLRYFEPRAGTVRLAYGRRDLQAPQYDLSLLAQQVMGAAAREAALPAPGDGDRPPGQAPAPALLSPAAFWTLLVVAVLAIAWVIGKALRADATRGT